MTAKASNPNGSAYDVAPDRWTQKMIQSWKAAAGNRSTNKLPVNLNDLIEPSNSDQKLTTPRSILACLCLGIDPSELVHKSLDAFDERGLSKDLQKVKYEYHESLRNEKIQKLLEERNRLIKQEEEEKEREMAACAEKPAERKDKCSSNLSEKNKKRLERIRRRQLKELEQAAKFEARRQQVALQNQSRLEAERKAEEFKRQEKLRKEKEWQTEQRKKELQKIKEEEAMDRKSRQLAAKRHLLEQGKIAFENRRQRQAHREAMRKEQERIQKQEEFRKQMEKAQEAQNEVLRKKQEEMRQKDLERQRFLEEQHKERLRQNMEARKQSEARHAAAIENFRQLMQKRTEEYQRRHESLKIKLKQQEERQKLAEIEKKKKETVKEQQRLEVIKEAQAERERKAQELIQKSQAADMMLQNFIMQRQLAHARRVVERQLEFENKHARVESMRRIKALQRHQLFQRIERESERVRRLIEARNAEQERRRIANDSMSFHRETMLQKMEKLAISKKFLTGSSRDSHNGDDDENFGKRNDKNRYLSSKNEK